MTVARVLSTALLVMAMAVRAAAQTGTANAPTAASTATPPARVPAVTDERILLAASDSRYPVTPGDVYQLTFWLSAQPTVALVTVESDWALNLGLFGKIDTRGMTFAQIKPVVEKMVTAAYPRSTPATTIVSVGIFQVPVAGEIPQARMATAWGLSRLSELVGALLGPYSSNRDIEVQSADGSSARYDLFKAITGGDLDQDPVIRPGQRIVVRRLERQVEVRGEVLRPGKYQLVAGEGLRELVAFAGGFTGLADRTRIRISRPTGDHAGITAIDFDDAVRSGRELKDSDTVAVPAMNAVLPTVFFEGAVSSDTSGTTAGVQVPPSPDSSGRFALSFEDGETLAAALRLVRGMLSPLADLADAYIIRQGGSDVIAVDCQKLLYDPAAPGDLPLQPFDRIVIPQQRLFVRVTGAVEAPGSYPYLPRKPYSYYLGLAGTGVPEVYDPQSVSVFDSQGNQKSLDQAIQPLDRIVVVPLYVMVTGAVFRPGAVLFQSEEPVDYYVKFAGGVDPDRSTDGAAKVYDDHGNLKPPEGRIVPGDTINVVTNSFFYNFNKYLPALTAAAAFITAVIGVVNLFR